MFNNELSPTLRRLLFWSHAISNALSACEAFARSKHDIASFDNIVGAAARKCMRGKAFHGVKLADNEGNTAIDERSSMSRKDEF